MQTIQFKIKTLNIVYSPLSLCVCVCVWNTTFAHKVTLNYNEQKHSGILKYL